MSPRSLCGQRADPLMVRCEQVFQPVEHNGLEHSTRLTTYVEGFKIGDFDTVRAILADEPRSWLTVRPPTEHPRAVCRLSVIQSSSLPNFFPR
jgi:hypothetical protein